MAPADGDHGPRAPGVRTSTPSLTLAPLARDLKAAIKRRLRRAVDAVGWSLAQMADGVGYNPTVAERWAKASVDHDLPLWVLGSVAAVPDALYRELLAEVEALRAQQPGPAPARPEAAVGRWLAAAGAAVARVAEDVADGKLDDRAGARAAVATMRAQCDAVDAALDASEGGAAPLAPVRRCAP